MANTFLPLSRVHASGPTRFLLKVETSEEAADYARYERLRNAVWGFPEDHLAGTRNLMCENFLHEGSSLFLAAYAEGEEGAFVEDPHHLVGFAYGYVGVKDKSVAFRSLDNLWFYAQYMAVRPDVQRHGLGVALKEFQRDILLEIYGVATVVCTYDPLTGVNANRNIHHFGMSVLEYRPATYGEYGGLLNRLDVPTDRFFASWNLKREPARPAYDLADLVESPAHVFEVERRLVSGKTGRLELEILIGSDFNRSEPCLLFRIPRDFYGMLRETDVDDASIRRIPVEWRLRSREAFLGLLGRGYKVIDFRQVLRPEAENYYVLGRD